MFGGPFNRMPFNRSLTIEALFSVTFESTTELEAQLNLEMPLSASFEVLTEFASDMTREISFGALFESSTELLSEMIRERLFTSTFESITEFTANLKLYHIDMIEFVGSFAPGDRIFIDSGKFKITQNGLNVSDLYNGDFFDLNLGTNNLTYTDSETGRQVLIRITHEDKFLY
ncbi:hypothetical protein P4H66_19395 [Paenibacillus dokdonensis]|uniref:Siphovirus-type tail component C-terminal domain-containing protein n=1 Tax=Paenibacillus dokdonensis TaxID=2567944 RepID=A0ABU6GQH9_9BACL|nr:hypothetical protein [Paenibacillus dokdonensis]MEC0241971.1 hypothetical protein [Paenibacillus dokdonensis]